MRQFEAVPVFNDSGGPIPAFGLMRSKGINASGQLVVDLPDSDSATALLVNGPCVIPDQTAGQGDTLPRCVVAYDQADGYPAAGDVWGAKAGEPRLRLGRTGFTCLSPGGMGLVNAMRTPPAGSVSADSAMLGSNYDITASTTDEDVGLEIDLPAAGPYVLFFHADVSGGVDASGKYFEVRLYADGVQVPGSTGRYTVPLATTSPTWSGIGNIAVTLTYTAAAPETVKLVAWRLGSATWSLSRVLAGAHVGYIAL
jgi:hypothetical protein